MEKLRKNLSDIWFAIRYSWRINPRLYVACGLLIVLDTVEPFALLILPNLIIDELTGLRRWDVVLRYILLFIGVFTLIRLIRMVFSVFINMSINRSDVFAFRDHACHFLYMDYAKMEDSKVRDMQQKVSRTIHPNSFVYTDLRVMLTGFFQLIGYSYLIFTLHPLILLAVFAIVVANYLLSRRSEKNKYNFQPTSAEAERKFDYLYTTMSDFSFAKEVRINQASRWLSQKFIKTLDGYLKPYKHYQNRQLFLKIAAVFLQFVQTVILYGYAAFQVIAGKITVGDFSVYVGSIFNFSDAFVNCISSLIRISYWPKYVKDYQEFLQVAHPSYLDKSIIELKEPAPQHQIEFRNVSFRYPNTERMVLKNVSITISDKEKLAVVGINGAGKSTFIKLICRLYEPTEGVILYNGVDISTIRYQDYIKEISVVFQDFQLFAFSVKENIILNQPDRPVRVIDAIRQSGLEEKLSTLPNGLDTAMGKDFEEDGIEFSGGEGQKLVTARAYYKKAPIVILDEPTAALDPLSEHNLYLRFQEIMKDRTAIFISHRLASTRFCDRIAVFADGQIVECGSHEQLMTQKGLYCDMFEKQASHYIKKEDVQ